MEYIITHILTEWELAHIMYFDGVPYIAVDSFIEDLFVSVLELTFKVSDIVHASVFITVILVVLLWDFLDKRYGRRKQRKVSKNLVEP